jgi:hypothetical protein
MPEVSYKEFFSDNTFFICCEPADEAVDPKKTDICLGI